MKFHLQLLAACVFAAGLPATATPLLQTGETFTYEFSSLPFTGFGANGVDPRNATIPPFTLTFLWWTAVPFEDGTQLEVKLFENSLSETPAYQTIVQGQVMRQVFFEGNPPSPRFTQIRDISGLAGPLAALWDPAFTDFWRDLQGAFSFTVLSGSVYLRDIKIQEIIPTSGWNNEGWYEAGFYGQDLVFGPYIRVEVPVSDQAAGLGVVMVLFGGIVGCHRLQNSRQPVLSL